MIPYDDLVNALQAWRVRQGLAEPPADARGFGPDSVSTSPGIGAMPASEESLDVDESLIAESLYDDAPRERSSDTFGGSTDIEPHLTASTKAKKRDPGW
ncbi:MAG: hypothetical protein AB7L28_11595 [Kofleriaceae bacterium]